MAEQTGENVLDAVRARAEADARKDAASAESSAWHRWYDAVLRCKALRQRFSDIVGVPEGQITVQWQPSHPTPTCLLWLDSEVHVLASDAYERGGDATFWVPVFLRNGRRITSASSLLATVHTGREDAPDV